MRVDGPSCEVDGDCVDELILDESSHQVREVLFDRYVSDRRLGFDESKQSVVPLLVVAHFCNDHSGGDC